MRPHIYQLVVGIKQTVNDLPIARTIYPVARLQVNVVP